MHFVVCVDGSEQSDRALEHAADLVDATDGSLTVVHVVEPKVYEQAGEGPISTRSEGEKSLVLEGIEDAENRGEEVLEEAREAVPFEVEDVLLYGDADDAIAQYVETREGIDGVIVGHRMVSERRREMLGSVARGLIELSPVPVTVVRE
ncbi:universal stress protein UspA-like protein [Salinarchaeum sp. Harcht-Bsk1]|uniref:universal stress protein n=1 Tax=Salinarchaeum sp. Harcht-Bsk1 TaxID=1333523 RepID=UPI00034228CC|nr:universal stress protein [Salinarchaeum sp. Harcht-Bsk1]AGN01770.1 universal stress protein UspA-like protein [Salinarchaeum sp. Harcht-Bsk1]